MPSAPQTEHDQAERYACRETWRPYPSRRPTSQLETLSADWFKAIEQRRYARHGNWIPRLFEFNRHRGEQVLGLGEGLGTDWVRFAQGGAHMHLCCRSLAQMKLVSRNFELRDLKARFMRGSYDALPLNDASMDVVCISGLLDSFESLDSILTEVQRVLKPGGKVLAALPAKYDASYWQNACFPWLKWFGERTVQEQNGFSGRSLKQLFARFTEHRVYKRHLRRSDLPHIWRWMLLPLLERIMGRFLLIKAFKPLFPAVVQSRAA